MASQSTHGFYSDGRSREELRRMRDAGYVEDPEYMNPVYMRTDGYFCGSCGAYENTPGNMPQNPGPHDGYCHKFNFRDRDYGCCNGWYKK